ncbi:MAG: M48 family metallopeptidase [SAR202 cluster bacterium]|nr:M48 family metallopeptidase [SAR202 cluster bacterium]
MNFIALIVLIFISLEFLFNTLAAIMNLKNLKLIAPESVRDVFTESEYKKSQQYLRHNTIFDLITEALKFSILLIFWFTGSFQLLDDYVKSFEMTEIYSGLIYIGLILTGYILLGLLTSIYSVFVIEEKFGFNKTTPIIFVSDFIKTIVLFVLIGLPIIFSILWFFEYMGNFAWLYCWILVALASIVIQVVAPIWIMPLFNKFTNLSDGTLKNKISKYAQEVGFEFKNIQIMDGSKRSSKANAFFTGFGKSKKIAFFDTMIEDHSEDEIIAVLAHEIGHYKLKHILKATVLSIVNSGVIFFMMSLVIKNQLIFDAFYLENISTYAGFIIFGILYSPISLIISIFSNYYSRINEINADKWSIETTGLVIELGDALKRLARNNLVNLSPHPFYVFLHYTHPPLIDRLEIIKNLNK